MVWNTSTVCIHSRGSHSELSILWNSVCIHQEVIPLSQGLATSPHHCQPEVCVCVCVCVYVCVCVCWGGMAAEGWRSGITGSSELHGNAGLEPRSFERAASAVTAEPSLQSHFCDYPADLCLPTGAWMASLTASSAPTTASGILWML